VESRTHPQTEHDSAPKIVSTQTAKKVEVDFQARVRGNAERSKPRLEGITARAAADAAYVRRAEMPWHKQMAVLSTIVKNAAARRGHRFCAECAVQFGIGDLNRAVDRVSSKQAISPLPPTRTMQCSAFWPGAGDGDRSKEGPLSATSAPETRTR